MKDKVIGLDISAFFRSFPFLPWGKTFGIIVNYEVMSKCTVLMKYQTDFNLGLFLLENKG